MPNPAVPRPGATAALPARRVRRPCPVRLLTGASGLVGLLALHQALTGTSPAVRYGVVGLGALALVALAVLARALARPLPGDPVAAPPPDPDDRPTEPLADATALAPARPSPVPVAPTGPSPVPVARTRPTPGPPAVAVRVPEPRRGRPAPRPAPAPPPIPAGRDRTAGESTVEEARLPDAVDSALSSIDGLGLGRLGLDRPR